MTRDEFYGAPLVCPYCAPEIPRAQREIPANFFNTHRINVHQLRIRAADPFAQRDEELVEAARQRAFERSVTLGSTVLVRWEESGCRLEARGTVMVLGAGFFRIEVGTASEWVRVPEYGCPGWSLTNCVRPAWEHADAAGQVAP